MSIIHRTPQAGQTAGDMKRYEIWILLGDEEVGDIPEGFKVADAYSCLGAQKTLHDLEATNYRDDVQFAIWDNKHEGFLLGTTNDSLLH